MNKSSGTNQGWIQLSITLTVPMMLVCLALSLLAR